MVLDKSADFTLVPYLTLTLTLYTAVEHTQFDVVVCDLHCIVYLNLSIPLLGLRIKETKEVYEGEVQCIQKSCSVLTHDLFKSRSIVKS